MNGSVLPPAESLLAEFRSRVTGDPATALYQLIDRLQRASAPALLWQQLAMGLFAKGDARSAGTLLEHGLVMYPHETQLRYLLGNALQIQGMHAAAERELRAVLAVDPKHADAALSLAYLLREQACMRKAVEVMLERLEHMRGDVDAARRTALFIAQCNHPEQALRVCTRALELGPDAKSFTLSGSLAMTLGQFERAAADLRRAVELDPNHASAWLWLALAHKFRTSDDPDLVAFEIAAAKHPPDSPMRVHLGFALGKAYDDLGDIPAAVRVLREANDAVAKRVSWQTREWDRFVARQIDETPPPPLARSVSDFMPVFVVGMPRTGTTLTAAMLGRHPDVKNRGELGWLGAAAEQGAPHHYPHEFVARMEELYRRQLVQDDRPARCYIDKNPFNFRYLGLAGALFPQARVIHCSRDRRDTALSIWRQYFANPETGYAYRFSDMAEVFQGHDRLMTHWRASLTLPIYELDYETLVTRPAETIADVLRFLGLDPAGLSDDAVDDQPAVSTASMWQVRQPVYPTSVGRWRAYAPYVPELAQFEPESE